MSKRNTTNRKTLPSSPRSSDPRGLPAQEDALEPEADRNTGVLDEPRNAPEAKRYCFADRKSSC